MKKWFVILLACFASRAAEPFEKGAISDNRFLLILNTSYGMRHDRAAAETCLIDLIRGGVQGRMQAGDTFGIWTFNNKLHAGAFPMQIWAPALNTTLARQVQEFLALQSYDNKTHFEAITAPLAAVVQSSKSLLVFLVTDGAEPVKGTPFDDALNATIKKNYPALKARHLPFVFVMGIEDGQYKEVRFNSTLNLKLPEIARVPLKIATPPRTLATNAAPVTAAPASTNPPVAAPLYVAPKLDSVDSIPEAKPEVQPAPPVQVVPPPPTETQMEKQSSTVPLAQPPTLQQPVLSEIPKNAPSPSAPTNAPSSRTEPSDASPGQSPVANQANSKEVAPLVQQTPKPSSTAAVSPPIEATNRALTKPLGPQELAQTTSGSGKKENAAMLLWAASAFVFAAIALAWTLLRGSRTRPEQSLISRSIEKNKRDG